MTYNFAKMIIWNPDAYTKDQVCDACIFILGTIGIKREDLDQALLLI